VRDWRKKKKGKNLKGQEKTAIQEEERVAAGKRGGEVGKMGKKERIKKLI